MQRAKEERQKEIQMTSIVMEILTYCLFLWLLTILSYGNRDPSAYFLQKNIKDTFVFNSDSDFSQMKLTNDFWAWTNKTLIPNVVVGKWYNGFQPYGLRGFLEDRVNRKMGYAVLRQIRVKPHSCKVPKPMNTITTNCHSYSDFINEDKRDYHIGWKSLDLDLNTNSSQNTPETEFYKYSKAKKLKGVPFWGVLDVYGGGGYVVPLRGTHKNLRDLIQNLQKNDWIDSGTRAVFVEFSVYNAQVNLFAVVTMVAEFQPGGGIFPTFRVDTLRLMKYHQGFGLFVLLVELSYVIYVVYFTVREVKKFWSDKKEYFKSYWSYAEMLVIGLSYAAITFYAYRMLITRKILKKFTETHGNGYIKLQYVATVDEVFGYLVSFLIFVATLKFIKILRFNKRMGMLYSTLSQCAQDLKSFIVVFLIIFLAFVQLFYLVFGPYLKGYSNFVNSAETAFAMARGKFDFQELYMVAPLLGPILFFVFSLITAVVLMNIFITLIISAFQSVKADLSKQNNEFEVVDFMFNKVKGAFGMKPSINSSGDAGATGGITTVDGQVKELPRKVHQLLNYINEVYLNGQIDVKSDDALKKFLEKGGATGVSSRRLALAERASANKDALEVLRKRKAKGNPREVSAIAERLKKNDADPPTFSWEFVE